MIDTPTRRAVLGAGVFAAGSLLGDRAWRRAEAPLAADACLPRRRRSRHCCRPRGRIFKPSSPERIELY